MKRLFQLIVFLVPFFYLLDAYSGHLEAEQHADFSLHEKTYVTPEQLGFGPNTIFVNVDGEWFWTDSLQTDDKGFFVQHLWPQEDGCRKGFVPCRNCDRCVKWYYDICPYCEKPV